MRGEQYLRKTSQYTHVYRTGKSRANEYFVTRYAPNALPVARWGISVSRRVGGAVVRNLVKRRFREILRQTALKPGWDIVIIARQPAAQARYATLMEAVCETFSRAQLLQANETPCPASDQALPGDALAGPPPAVPVHP